MNNIVFWQSACYFFVFFLFAGYTILDGFDLGIGMMLPFFHRSPERREELIDTIWPFWDGNELWGLAAVTVLFAGFPPVYSEVLRKYYPAVVFIFLCLILRPVLFELRYHDEKRSAVWEGLFTAVSFLLAFAFGAALGSSLLSKGAASGSAGGIPIANLFKPVSILSGFLWVVFMLTHGAFYAVRKASAETGEKAEFLGKKLSRLGALLFAAVMLTVFLSLKGSIRNIGTWTGILLFIVFFFLLQTSFRRNSGKTPVLLNSLGFAGIWIFYISNLFPDFVKNTDPSLSLNLYNASSPLLTLKILTAAGVISMALVVFYTSFVYRAFKGKRESGNRAD